jgi:hypothetical protein
VLLDEGGHITGHEDVVIGDDVLIGPTPPAAGGRPVARAAERR